MRYGSRLEGWSLRLDSSARDFGGNGQERIARELAIPSEAIAMPIPGYTVALFLEMA